MDIPIPPFQNAGRWLEQLESPETAPDALGRTTFVHALTDALVRLPTDRSVVTAVYGPWGCGKTWLLEQVVQRLDHEYGSEMITCRFSPWELKSEDQILAEFFATISARIPREAATKDLIPLWTKLQQFTTIGAIGSTGLISALALTGALQGEGLTAANAAAPMLQSIASLFGQAKESASDQKTAHEPQTLRDVKDQLARELKEKLSRPILVIIDDLDRLTHPEIQLMIRLLNTTANLPKIHYLIFGDRQQIASALNPVCGNEGDRYLEKLVQNSFQVPEPGQNEIQSRLWDGLTTITEQKAHVDESMKKRFTHFWHSFLTRRVRNLRDCHRLLRTYAFHVGSLTKSGTLEVDPIDLIGIDFIRLFDPPLYYAIATNPPTEDLYPRRQSAEKKADSRYILNLIETSTLGHELAAKFLTQIFPAIGGYIENLISTKLLGITIDIPGNIGTPLCVRYPKRAPSYFTLTILEDTQGIPEHAIREFTLSIEDLQKLTEQIKYFCSKNWIPELFQRMIDFPDPSFKSRNASNILRAFARNSKGIISTIDNGISPNQGFKKINEVIDFLINEMNQSHTMKDLLPAITESNEVEIPLLLLEKLRRWNNCTYSNEGIQEVERHLICPAANIEDLSDEVEPTVAQSFARSGPLGHGIWLYRMYYALGPERCDRILKNNTVNTDRIWPLVWAAASSALDYFEEWSESIDSNSPAPKVLRELEKFAPLDFWERFLTNNQLPVNIHPHSELIARHLRAALNIEHIKSK